MHYKSSLLRTEVVKCIVFVFCPLVQMYKSHFERSVNPTNLAMLINSYIHRTDLQIARTPSGTPQAAATLKMPVINITGALSPHVDDTVTFNGRLDPTNSSWMKVNSFHTLK